MLYRLFGFWIRREACRLAAQALRATDIDEGYAPRIWSLTVFFENYMLEGAEGTQADFGPPEAVEFNVVTTTDAAG